MTEKAPTTKKSDVLAHLLLGHVVEDEWSVSTVASRLEEYRLAVETETAEVLLAELHDDKQRFAEGCVAFFRRKEADHDDQCERRVAVCLCPLRAAEAVLKVRQAVLKARQA